MSGLAPSSPNFNASDILRPSPHNSRITKDFLAYLRSITYHNFITLAGEYQTSRASMLAVLRSLLVAKVKIRPSFWEHDHCLPFSLDLAPQSIFGRHKDYLVFDIETKDLAPSINDVGALASLGISVVCAYDSKVGKMLTFFEDDLPQLIKLMNERLVIGYNIRRFDLPVMTGYGLKMENVDIFDLMEEVERGLGRRFIKLEYVSQGTLGEGKSADGKLAVEWYKQGRIQEVAEYCARDVEVTHRVFRNGLDKGFLAVKFPEKDRIEFRVDWK